MKSKHEIISSIETQRLIAILRLSSSEGLVPIAEALVAGGCRIMEVTMTTPGALNSIRAVHERFGDSVEIGVGSVVDAAGAEAAVAAGARFVVTPVLKQEIIEFCRKEEVACISGAFTPTEIQQAWEWGADLVKVFPATALGPSYIRDILAPLPHLRLIPTGGVNLDNLSDFLAAGARAVAVGSSLVDRKAVAAGHLELITERARQYGQAAHA